MWNRIRLPKRNPKKNCSFSKSQDLSARIEQPVVFLLVKWSTIKETSTSMFFHLYQLSCVVRWQPNLSLHSLSSSQLFFSLSISPPIIQWKFSASHTDQTPWCKFHCYSHLVVLNFWFWASGYDCFDDLKYLFSALAFLWFIYFFSFSIGYCSILVFMSFYFLLGCWWTR